MANINAIDFFTFPLQKVYIKWGLMVSIFDKVMEGSDECGIEKKQQQQSWTQTTQMCDWCNDNTKSFRVPYPIHTHMMQYSKRIDSFRQWSDRICKKPEDLAEAGFFYTGQDDLCVCFYCGMHYNGWSRFDDPFTVHRRFNNDCIFYCTIKNWL